ncbi:MAG: OmpA/MotB domain protein [Sphingobacteriaceae bacterium]|jgi:outer membrane protein OmpA-like peptidoglycan-associated protein|nr:OmpA/MotB domain protein [Sphingobacteriaceae bacterium]
MSQTNRINVLLLSAALLLIFSTSASSQDKQKNKALLKTAEKEYQSLRFISAIKALKPLLKADSANVKAQELIAGSYRNLRDYEQTLYWYEKLSKAVPLRPENALYYAEALANNEHYEESEQWYRKYLSMVPADKRASSFVKTDPSVFSKDKGEWKIAKTNINSPASDYSPAYYKEGLLLVSNRFTNKLTKNVFQWDQTPFSDLYVIDKLSEIEETSVDTSSKKKSKEYVFNDDDTEQTSNDSPTPGQYNFSILKDIQNSSASDKLHPAKGKVNSKLNEGPGVVMPDGTLIFTRNNFYNGKAALSEQGFNKLNIYITDGDNWDKIEEYPFNNNEYSTGHPSISKDGTFMVFVSDMPGGFGGTDLYYSVRTATDQKWGRPVNLGGRINTEGNELFPYMDKDDKLFFSSTGYAGLGGLDIFEVTLRDLKPEYSPRNLGAPFNSSADDFGFIRSNDGRSGYFSSNREGNDDIYSYKRQSYIVALKGTLIDATTKLPVMSGNVYLRHDGYIDTISTNPRGQFSVNLNKETDYEIIGYKEGYLSSNKLLSSVGIKSDTTFNVTLYLNKADRNQQWVLNNCDSLKRKYFVENIYYALDKSEIRPEARQTLDKVADMMKRYPEINIITASHTDSRASAEYNKSLSLRRGNSARSYLMAKGISPSRITVEYYGKTRLVNNCYDGVPCSEEDQQLNRRTEFEIILNNVNLSQLDCKQK